MLIICLTAAYTRITPAESPTASSISRQLAHNDLAKLQGTWRRASMELKGTPWTPRQLEGWTTTYRGDAITLYDGSEVYRRGIVTLDPTQTPKAVNTWDLDGPFQDQTVPGIYELNGDTMRVCFAMPGNPRPTEFTSKHGTGFLYCEYKREPLLSARRLQKVAQEFTCDAALGVGKIVAPVGVSCLQLARSTQQIINWSRGG
ncbi:MAG TPA: TIGR03067 domain-containing protein [Lacipirellulaceae bacterium]|nr:TIGR03067 domain-containing protein [Lacipirellulaceae bacterium]